MRRGCSRCRGPIRTRPAWRATGRSISRTRPLPARRATPTCTTANSATTARAATPRAASWIRPPCAACTISRAFRCAGRTPSPPVRIAICRRRPARRSTPTAPPRASGATPPTIRTRRTRITSAAHFLRCAPSATARRVGTGASFDHNLTGFPLTGAHVATACAACHGDGVYKGKSKLCVSCHQTEYNGTTNPPHVASGFPTTCETCHSTTNWTGATFNHNSTNFPLTGAHQAVACNACHGDGVYKGKSTLCVSCHQTDYNNTTDPAHAAAGFATTCETCHSTTNWTSATFNHSTTSFPLTGRARERGLQRVSRRRRVQGQAHHLRVVPPGRLQRHDQPGARRCRIRPDLRPVPHDVHVGGRDLRPRQQLLPDLFGHRTPAVGASAPTATPTRPTTRRSPA